jgi:hypothetical protein
LQQKNFLLATITQQSVLYEHQDDMHWTLGSLRDLQTFSGFEFFLLPSRVYARPSATARRASSQTQTVGRLVNEDAE